MFAADGGFHLKDSSAAVSAANDVALRSNDGVFEVSQNGGAFTPVGTGSPDWVQTALDDAVTKAGLTKATTSVWTTDCIDDPNDGPLWDATVANSGTVASDITVGGGVWKFTAITASASYGLTSYRLSPVLPPGATRWYMTARVRLAVNPATDTGFVRIGARSISGTYAAWFGHASADANWGFELYDGTIRTKNSATAFDTSTHTIVLAFDATTITLYVDGSSVATQAYSGFATLSEAMVPQVYIGNNAGSSGARVAYVDNFAIFTGRPTLPAS